MRDAYILGVGMTRFGKHLARSMKSLAGERTVVTFDYPDRVEAFRPRGSRAMELEQVIGRRRSTRYLRPYKPVEREKVQRRGNHV